FLIREGWNDITVYKAAHGLQDDIPKKQREIIAWDLKIPNANENIPITGSTSVFKDGKTKPLEIVNNVVRVDDFEIAKSLMESGFKVSRNVYEGE
ncbi:hypothetical protein, partial [Leptospira andrefontaineae]|uniref:hypothetical protein n=1 Tax=Leptospira andrefontaineae TaxID=2484976 RepID=UPI00142DAAAF